LQESYALLVTPDGGELIMLPQLPAALNGIVRTAKLTLTSNGTLSGDFVEQRNGDYGTQQRATLKSVTKDGDRVKFIETLISHSLSAFQITKASFSNLNQLDQPFGYQYSLVAQNYAKTAGNLLLVRPRVLGSNASDLLEKKEPRMYPVEFDGPTKNTDTIEIALSAGYEVDDLPPPVNADYSFASYHSKTELNGNTLKYTRTFEVKELSVPLGKVEDLKRTLPRHRRRRTKYRGAKADGSLIPILISARMISSQGRNRPNGVRAPDQKRGEAEGKHRMAEACAEVLPEGCSRTGIIRREEQREHEQEGAEACGAHQDAENEREPDRQFTISHQEGHARGVPEDKAAKNGRHERVSASLEEFVDPELKAAMKSKCCAENFVLAKNQEKNTHADAKHGK